MGWILIILIFIVMAIMEYKSGLEIKEIVGGLLLALILAIIGFIGCCLISAGI